ncbi:hypothetical protein PMAYCL1PPCAC_13657, partial [Pristionchus mayeri]
LKMSPLLPLTFVSGNPGKVSEVASALDGLYEVTNVDIDLDEIQGDIEEIARRKCEEATNHVEGFVMVEDTGLEFTALGGLPGPYIKWFLKSMGSSGLHSMLEGFEDKGGRAVCALAYASGRGEPVTVVKGVCEGRIVAPRGEGNFGWDSCFEPAGSDKTFAEMTKEEKNACSHRSRALATLREELE